MSAHAADDLEIRLSALAARIERSGEQLEIWIEPLSVARSAVSEAKGETSPSSSAREEQLLKQAQLLQAQLEFAESSASLQAQRCRALEDRVSTLDAELVATRDQGTRAAREAEAARSAASKALDELEAERSAPRSGREREQSGPIVATLQSKLLENDRLRSERDNLRRSLDEWRKQARTLRRERDEASTTSTNSSAQLDALRKQRAADKERIDELERALADQTRELEVARARTEHMRERMRVATR